MPRILIALACTLLAGCQSGYVVDVRNLADQPVEARIMQRRLGEMNKVLDSARIGPGDRDRVGPVTAPLPGGVFVEIDFPGNTAHVSEMDLDAGTTVINVHRRDAGARGSIELEVVPRP